MIVVIKSLALKTVVELKMRRAGKYYKFTGEIEKVAFTTEVYVGEPNGEGLLGALERELLNVRDFLIRDRDYFNQFEMTLRGERVFLEAIDKVASNRITHAISLVRQSEQEAFERFKAVNQALLHLSV